MVDWDYFRSGYISITIYNNIIRIYFIRDYNTATLQQSATIIIFANAEITCKGMIYYTITKLSKGDI